MAPSYRSGSHRTLDQCTWGGTEEMITVRSYTNISDNWASVFNTRVGRSVHHVCPEHLTSYRRAHSDLRLNPSDCGDPHTFPLIHLSPGLGFRVKCALTGMRHLTTHTWFKCSSPCLNPQPPSSLPTQFPLGNLTVK